jgi:NAD(P)-dependent dehydrogenase (short-subunit alcohol dehydrogenase family)
MAERFVQERARSVVISDFNEQAMLDTAADFGQPAIHCDVGDPAALDALITGVEDEIGPIALARVQRRIRVHRRRCCRRGRAALRLD